MPFRYLAPFVTLTLAMSCLPGRGEAADGTTLRWQPLPPLPDREGFASPFSGVSNGALLVAGGSNFPAGRPWDGGTKVWYDTVFALPAPAGPWLKVGQLPRVNAYGVSVSIPGGVVCIGGGSATAHYRDVLLLHWDGQKLHQRRLSDLPRPCAFMSGALLGSTVYIAGGIEHPNDTAAQGTFWALDLAKPGAVWRELPPWPGPARLLADAAVVGDVFYLFSGAALSAGPDGAPVRTYLQDAFAYRPGQGWKTLAAMPHPAGAAPSPAPVSPAGKIFIIGGADGNGGPTRPDHPGLQREVLAYDPASDRWHLCGVAPFSRCTVPTAFWLDRWIIPNGENKPGYRTPEVWALTLE